MKIFFTYLDSKLQTFQPAARHYTYWAIPAHIIGHEEDRVYSAPVNSNPVFTPIFFNH
jgi:hypothetical protein